MKRWLTAALVFAVLAAFGGLPAAQQKEEGGVKPPAAGERLVDKGTPKLMTGRVTAVDPKAKTFTLLTEGKSVRFSSTRKPLPAVGTVIDLTENSARFVFNTCEECNAVCPGVCFLGPNHCRCYLEHLRTK